MLQLPWSPECSWYTFKYLMLPLLMFPCCRSTVSLFLVSSNLFATYPNRDWNETSSSDQMVWNFSPHNTAMLSQILNTCSIGKNRNKCFFQPVHVMDTAYVEDLMRLEVRINFFHFVLKKIMIAQHILHTTTTAWTKLENETELNFLRSPTTLLVNHMCMLWWYRETKWFPAAYKQAQ